MSQLKYVFSWDMSQCVLYKTLQYTLETCLDLRYMSHLRHVVAKTSLNSHVPQMKAHDTPVMCLHIIFGSHIHAACPAHEPVMSRTWTSHVTRTNESCRTFEWVLDLLQCMIRCGYHACIICVWMHIHIDVGSWILFALETGCCAFMFYMCMHSCSIRVIYLSAIM